MSLKYRDKNGAEHVLAGLTPGGDIEYGAVATRQGTVTIPSLAANQVTTTEITFSEPMPDNNYEVTFTVSSLSGPQGGNTLFMPFSKTPNGFVLAGYNGNSAVVEGTTLVWKAFKLYEVADAEALYSTVQDIEKAFPADASSSNKLATIRDVTSETRSLDRRIDDLEDYMPSNVSISNKVATQADLANVSIDELGDIEDVDLDDVADGQTLVWDSANSKWVNGQGGKVYSAGDGINISNTDEISAKVDDTSITTDTNDALKVADTYKTIFVGTQAQWNALSTADKVKYSEAHITDDVIGGEVADEVTDGDMRPVTSNAVAGVISNPNLLDNPWFTVNQRGQSSYVWDTDIGYKYTVDRWHAYKPNIQVTSDGLVYAYSGGTATGSKFSVFRQFIEDYSYLAGKTVTLSTIVNGTLYKATGVFPSAAGDPSITIVLGPQTTMYVTFQTGQSYPKVSITNYSTTAITIRAIKLELGSVSTLAMDTAPNYQQELAKCQRYFIRLRTSSTHAYAHLGSAMIRTATQARIFAPLPVTMRESLSVTANIAIAGGLKLIKQDGTASVPITAVALDSWSVNGVGLTVSTDSQSTIAAGTACEGWIHGSSDSYIDISADL